VEILLRPQGCKDLSGFYLVSNGIKAVSMDFGNLDDHFTQMLTAAIIKPFITINFFSL
jgi:hypothetical protein